MQTATSVTEMASVNRMEKMIAFSSYFSGGGPNQNSASSWLQNPRAHVRLKFVGDLTSALLALDDVHHGRLPVPDLIVVDQTLFDANSYQLVSYCQASPRLKNVDILVRPARMLHTLPLAG
jgi:hypothetical protein